MPWCHMSPGHQINPIKVFILNSFEIKMIFINQSQRKYVWNPLYTLKLFGRERVNYFIMVVIIDISFSDPCVYMYRGSIALHKSINPFLCGVVKVLGESCVLMPWLLGMARWSTSMVQDIQSIFLYKDAVLQQQMFSHYKEKIGGSVQGCCISIANALEILQPSI